MNNEEKILELLGKMNERMEAMEGKITGLESKVTGLEDRFTGMEQRVTNIESNMATKKDLENMATKKDLENLATKDETRAIRILIEYDIKEKLNLLSEGHQMLVDTTVPREEAIEQKEEITFIKNMLEVLAERVKRLEKAG